MGSQCSAALPGTIVRPCGAQRPCGVPLDGLSCVDEDCQLCGDDRDAGAPFYGHEHPLLHADAGGQPRSPRGPVPPWVASSSSRAPVDRTATGATPPRSPTAPRMTPPGLPDEGVASAASPGLSLAGCFDNRVIKDLYAAAREGNAQVLVGVLRQVNTTAIAQVCAAQGQPAPQASQPSSIPAECAERAADLVGAFLSKLREPIGAGGRGAESLLGVACFEGHLEVIRLLMVSRADPLAQDDDGSCALHRAAQSRRLLCAVMVLDRLQAGCRSISVSELTNAEGETPEMVACTAGASDIVRAFGVFADMQNDAEVRQLGAAHTLGVAEGQSHRGGMGTGELLAVIDLAAEARSPAFASATSLLRRSVAGCRMVQGLFKRIPKDQADLRRVVDRACLGIKDAEQVLLKTKWDPNDPGLDPHVRNFVHTAELRSAWQHVRADAMKDEGDEVVNVLEEFWQTHLTAETMVATIRSAMGDTFQLLLTVLWLYTREAWLRHILDALVTALTATTTPNGGASAAGAAEQTAGSTGAAPLLDLPSALHVAAPLFEALAPCMQLVQSALLWFEEEAGIRHSAVTYRPLQVPMLGLQRLVDRWVAQRQAAKEQEGAGDGGSKKPSGFSGGMWLALGAGSFFSSMAHRQEAIRRLSRTHCNVLLCIRPDDGAPCFPKHMMLRGSNVDDTLFPLDALFRITRITRTVSSDLDPDAPARGPVPKWPVMLIEVSSSSVFLEATEVLETRGDLATGELEQRMEDWLASAAMCDEVERLLRAGEFLAKLCGAGPGGRHVAGKRLHPTDLVARSWPGPRGEHGLELLRRALALAEKRADPEGAARALLVSARLGAPGAEAAGRKAIALLEEHLGMRHPDTVAARVAWAEVGVNV